MRMHRGLSKTLSAIVLNGLAVTTAAEPAWYWKTPQPPRNCVVREADPGKNLQNGTVSLMDNGDLAVYVTHCAYHSDAVTKDIETLWLVSPDGGNAWNQAARLSDPMFVKSLNPGTLDHRAFRLPAGTYIAAGSYGWENHADTPENRRKFTGQGLYFFSPEEGNVGGTISLSHRAWMAKSTDEGKTWKHEQIKLPQFLAHLCWYGGGVVLKDGSFVQPMWGRFDLKKEPRFVSSLLLRTEDQGDSWTIHTIAAPGDRPFDLAETGVTQAANGDLVAIIRTSGQRELWTAISKDGGKTWSEPRDSGLLGSTPWVVTTPDGLVVAVFVRRGGGGGETGVYACVSRDHGQSWDTAHQVAVFDGRGEVVDGYPSATALPDGSVYAVFSGPGARLSGVRFHPRHADFGK